MESSPFNRSSRTARSPPPTLTPPHRPAAPLPHQEDGGEAAILPALISTPEIQNWMTTIEDCLNEVCAVAEAGKLNTEQKLRISNLCRKVGHGTSQMAVAYQSLKQKIVQAYSSVQTFQGDLKLSQQLQDLKLSIQESVKPSTKGASFADMVKKSPSHFIQPEHDNSVTIYPEDKLKSSDETKSLVQNLINPEQMKLHVTGLRKTRNGGVVISTETKEDIEKLKQSDQIKKSGLTINETQKRRPRIVIIGVPTSMLENDVISCLYHQNLADNPQCTSFDTFLNTIKMSHKSGKKDSDTSNYVIEVPAAVRKALITKDKVFINWSSCPVRDFTLVTRCYKCQQYGHAARFCRESTVTCGHCGELGHTIKECLKKADDPKCATCLRFKKPSNHTTGAAVCPAKIMAEKRYISSIDYEGN